MVDTDGLGESTLNRLRAPNRLENLLSRYDNNALRTLAGQVAGGEVSERSVNGPREGFTDTDPTALREDNLL